MAFLDKFEKSVQTAHSFLCISLDTDHGRIPEFLYSEEDPIFTFNKAIVHATADLVCAYKLNLAFYESLGPAGWEAFRRTVNFIPKKVMIIADGKRGDIGNTSEKYAATFFEYFKCDALTVNPYMGKDSVQPFLRYKNKGIFFLCLTSNPGSQDIQRLEIKDEPLYMHVAKRVKSWNKSGNCGLVIGATHPHEIGEVRNACPEMPFLVPGIGAQGGDLENTVTHGLNKQGSGIIINAGRSIIYASRGKDYSKAAQQAAAKLRGQINDIRLQTIQEGIS